MKSGDTVHRHSEAGPPPRLRSELLFAAFAGVIAMLTAGWALHAWNMHLHVPIYPSGDASFTQMVVHTVIDRGWAATNPSIGAPFGSSLQDLSVVYGDATQLALTRVLALFSNDPAAIVNVLYLGGYGLIAAAGYLAIRGLGLPRAAALASGILFALIRYHFARAEGHLFLGLYYAVPALGWVLYGILGNHDLVRRRDGVTGWRGWLSRRTVLTVALAVIVGTSEVYYAVFGLMLLALVIPVTLLAGAPRRALVAAGIMGVIAFSAIAVQAPSLAYKAKHGKNAVVSVRSPTESDAYGLRLSDMIIPDRYHRFGPFAALGRDYFDRNDRDQEERYSGLDTLGTIGLLAALLTLLATAAGRLPTTHEGRLIRLSGLLAALAFLLGTVGGFGGIFAYLVSPTVRGWNRVAIVIAFFSLVAVAAGLSLAMRWLRESPRRPGWLAHGRRATVAAGALAVLVTVFGMWDQTSKALTPDYAGVLDRWRTEARFVEAIDQRLPANAMILQLPYAPFPENGPTLQMADYDQFFGYAHSSDLRWSYGAVKGRTPEDWGAVLDQLSPPELVRRAAASGFSGITIDTFAYAGTQGQTLINGISSAAGQRPLWSADRRRAYIDLTAYAAAQRANTSPQALRTLRASLLHPTIVRYGEGFLPTETDGTSTWHWAGPQGVVDVSRAAGTPVDVAFNVRTPGNAPSKIIASVAGKPIATFTVPPGRARSASFTLPADAQSFTLTTNAPDETADVRDLHMQIIDLTTRTP